ncbi:InlB B-repeat-containing protein, partial [Butyrivibrio sp. INlla14]|uniref:InlB B-repeat-containing protein n=1 Tax=Butyrivibrio sp. INlla14 TaxID=1520808 RepID=UPI0008760034
YGQTVTLADKAEAPGYDFDGWDTEDAEVSENSFTMPAKDVEVTGTFTAREDVKYTVEHYFQSLDNEEDYEIDDSLTETKDNGVADQDLSDEVLEGLKKTVEGFTYVEGGNKYFAGEEELGAPTVQGDGSLVIKLYYDREEYEVKYTLDENAIPEGVEVPEAKSYKYGEEVTVEADLIASGYVFSGWATAADIAIEDNKFEMPADDVEFIGVFEEITYIVTFEYRLASGVTAPANWDSLLEELKTHNGEFHAGDTLALPERPSLSGYVFGAWQIEKVENAEGETPFDRALAKAKELLALKVSAADNETIEVPEYDTVVYCIVDNAPTPPTPPPTPTPDPTPTTPVTIPDAPAPTAPAPAQAVLGARREEPTSGQAVLGARRARTEDTTNEATRVFAIILAAATAVTLLLTGKKKKEEEEG